MRLAFLALLCGDKDDTVGRAGSIDGSGGGILQNLDALDVVRVDEVDAAGRHTIHYIKRVRIVDCSDTSDSDLRSSVRRSGSLGDEHSGGHTLEHIVNPGLGLDLEVIGGDAGDGGGDNALFLNAVTDHDRLFDGLCVRNEGHLHVLRGRKLLRNIADERELEDGTLRDIDLEVTVGIGHSTVRGTFLNDPGSNETCTVLVKDGTFYMDGL